jgi:hypothetical protein
MGVIEDARACVASCGYGPEEMLRHKGIIRDLLAIVERLPRDAEGNPITPGMDLWLVSTGGPGWVSVAKGQPGVLGKCDGVYADRIRFNSCLYDMSAAKFYSTRAAAEAASKGERGGG